MTRNDEGYTLTEMLVVIAIIGLLAAVLTPTLVGQLSRARVKAAALQLQTVESALEAYRSDIGHLPSDQEGLGALVAAPAGAEGWLGPYLRDPKAVRDPWGRAFQYRETGEDAFEVTSLGSDGKPGGKGAAADLVGH
jgi:general secretion pathway protein G